MSEQSEIGERLRLIMKEYNLSMNAFAKEMEVPVGSIAAYINDGREPKFSFLSRLLKRFSKVNAEWLLTGKGGVSIKPYTEEKQRELSIVMERLELYQKLEKEREKNESLQKQLLSK